jgi:hypothetical protein
LKQHGVGDAISGAPGDASPFQRLAAIDLVLPNFGFKIREAKNLPPFCGRTSASDVGLCSSASFQRSKVKVRAFTASALRGHRFFSTLRFLALSASAAAEVCVHRRPLDVTIDAWPGGGRGRRFIPKRAT